MKLNFFSGAPRDAVRDHPDAASPALAMGIAVGVAVTAEVAFSWRMDFTAIFYSALIVVAAYLGRRYWLRVLTAGVSVKRIPLSVIIGLALPTIVLLVAFTSTNVFHLSIPHGLAIAPSYYLALFAGPIAETLLFQFWMQNRFGPLIACIAFIGVHFSMSPLIPLIAIALTLIQIRTCSIVCTILAHVAFNAAMFALWTWLAR